MNNILVFKDTKILFVCWHWILHLNKGQPSYLIRSGVARAFPGGQLAHPEGQNEEENEKSLRKSQKTWSKLEEKMRKVELLPTGDCEAGYGPANT